MIKAIFTTIIWFSIGMTTFPLIENVLDKKVKGVSLGSAIIVGIGGPIFPMIVIVRYLAQNTSDRDWETHFQLKEM